MKAQSGQNSDLRSPLPTRQFRWFLLLFHVVFLGMLGFMLFSHLRHTKGSADVTLIVLVASQALLYLFFFAFPSLAENSPGWKWFRAVLGKLSHPSNPDWPAWYWWFMYLGVSVALVLTEARKDRAFEWTLVAYVGQISGLGLRISVPGTIAIFGAWLLNRFGWGTLAMWELQQWFGLLMKVIPGAALVLFLGRTVATSGERGRLIVELETAKRELELARQRDAELAVLRERERLARDLHDSLGHSLVTLTVQLEATQRLFATDPARATVLLAEMQKLTRSSMEDLRRSLANLRTPGLGERPLADAIKTLCADAGKRSGISVECRIDDGARHLPPVVAEALWRVAQEGLTNVEKHAQAQRARASLTLEPKEVLLRVSDDGVGLPADAESKPGHYGLRGMRERVEGLGGTFTLRKNGSGGTIIEARVPAIA